MDSLITGRTAADNALGIDLVNYYNRFNENDNYEELLYRDGNFGQGAEQNEVQTGLRQRIKKIADALFKDGDVIRDAQIVVDHETGEVTAQNGEVYASGAVRGVPQARFTIPVRGTVNVGLYLTRRVVTELEDPKLYNPAKGSKAEGLPGAARLQVAVAWGYAGDGHAGDFYPVYAVDDGVVRSKETPPNLSAVTQALAGYDRDATGGSYIVSGLTLLQDSDTSDGRQVYNLKEGRARVNGFGVDLPTSRRVIHNALPELRFIENEGQQAAGGTQRVDVSFPPLRNITNVSITKQSSATLTHGAFSNCSDTIPITSVVEILSVRQGETLYVQGSDYALKANAVDWSLSGAEPATGSTYEITFRHLLTVAPDSWDETGFTVSDAVSGTLVRYSYNQMLPRIDTLAMDTEGVLTWLTGVSTTGTPRAPMVPQGLLGLASVLQTWTADRTVRNDGDRIVPNSDILALAQEIESVRQEVARQRLESDIATREAGAKKGLFVDPFIDDSQRDQGVEQTAAVVDGELTLPVVGIVASGVGNDVKKPRSLPVSYTYAVTQPLRTGSMKVNPYQAFALTQGKAVLTPAVDRWTEYRSMWTSPATIALTKGHGNRSSTKSSTTTRLANQIKTDIDYLRRIDVRFDVEGFGAGENLVRVMFDGIEVEAEPVTLE
uniref:DUF4815 domain-containing protein n=1 Tax=uncultured Bilophila sp. TaxID=529385 RepID=UPI0025D70D60|nr:DUF4815 domain-containing protein [uncultured Bilophila sp.]